MKHSRAENKLEINPYESPDTIRIAEAVWSKQEQQLWQVALWQKYLMWFLLIFIGSNVVLGYSSFVTEYLNGQEYRFDDITSFITLLTFVISWFVVTLSLVKMELIRHTKIAAVFVIIGMLIPVLNLLVLLGINGSATSFLRKHQVRVGLFGAEMGDIRRNLKKKVGEADPDKIGIQSITQNPILPQMAIPVEAKALPMMAKIVPVMKSDNSEA